MDSRELVLRTLEFRNASGRVPRQLWTLLPRLIDLGLDAFNTQIFCIGIDKLAPFKGKITFWGEIDRQHLIPSGTPREIDAAIQGVYDTLWQDGGLIAQCEFGAGANPDNVYRVYQKWREVRAGKAEDSR